MTPATEAPPAPLTDEDVRTALAAFTTATRRVEDYYHHLEDEVARLRVDLAARNRELERKVADGERMQAMLISTLQSLTCGVLAVARDRIVVAANPAACRLFGREVGTLATRPLRDVFEGVPASDTLIGALFGAGPESAEIEWEQSENGHRRRTVRLRAVRAAAPHDRGLAGLILAEDVTELRRLEEQEAVRSRLAGIGELAMQLAHEIRNPLGSMALYASTLAHELQGDPSLGPLAENLVGGVTSIEHVVNNALEYSRPRRMAMSRVDLAAAVRDALRYIEHPRLQKEIALDFDAAPAEDGAAEAWIAGDAEQLRQVFLNVGLNAIQAMESGGRLKVRLAPSGPEAWEVEFIDDGVGIPEADRQRVFDPLYTTKQKGSGIGLALCHRILTAHQARIEIDSEVGEGTTVRMIFPPFKLKDEG